MKKSMIITIAVVAIIIIVAVISVIAINSKPKTNLPQINSAEDLSALVDKLYEGQELFSSLVTQVIDVSNNEQVKMFTGLENGNDLEYAVASEPMITAQAYSLVLVKVKDGVNVNEVAKTMSENVDMRKWICVSAEILRATSSGDIVCLVMSDEEMTTSVYNRFKELAGNINEEYEMKEPEIQLPPDMY